MIKQNDIIRFDNKFWLILSVFYDQFEKKVMYECCKFRASMEDFHPGRFLENESVIKIFSEDDFKNKVSVNKNVKVVN